MSEIYKRIGNYNLVREGERFGLEGGCGEILLPAEYDSIFYESGGFIITRGSRLGYIKFREELPPHDDCEAPRGYPEGCAEVFIPCIYDRIEPTRNGLVLYSMTNDENRGEGRVWYDHKSGRLHKDLYFLRSYGKYDKLLRVGNPEGNPILKEAGEERYISFPRGISAEILYEVALYNGGAHYFVCSEELSDEEADRLGYICQYFFLIVLPDTYTFTEPRRRIVDLLEELPRLVDFWDDEARKEKEHAEGMARKNGRRNK